MRAAMGEWRVQESAFKRLMSIVEALVAVSPAEELEYWRGYRQGVLQRRHGVSENETFQHRFWMTFAIRGRVETEFENYATGYQVGFADLDGSPEDQIVQVRAKLHAIRSTSSRIADPASVPGTTPMNCWEFMKCGREKGGLVEKEQGTCPAYPDHGRSCARLIGTLCGGEVHGLIAKRIKDCVKCPFFQSLHQERIAEWLRTP
jgi:hypothetical protein